MDKLLAKVRAACEAYNMIEHNDKIAIGLSGGKDSLLMLKVLAKLKEFYKKKFELKAIFVDPCFFGEKSNTEYIKSFCDDLNVEFIHKISDIYKIVFDIRKEKNPCSLCANLRRGILCTTATEFYCNKIALGHHYDDAVETFFMNLFNCGRIGCFSPVSYLSKKDVTIIRPMIYCEESLISASSLRHSLPVLKSNCPMDKTSNREKTSDFISNLKKDFPDIKSKVIGAMRRANIDGWK